MSCELIGITGKCADMTGPFPCPYLNSEEKDCPNYIEEDIIHDVMCGCDDCEDEHFNREDRRRF